MIQVEETGVRRQSSTKSMRNRRRSSLLEGQSHGSWTPTEDELTSIARVARELTENLAHKHENDVMSSAFVGQLADPFVPLVTKSYGICHHVAVAENAFRIRRSLKRPVSLAVCPEQPCPIFSEGSRKVERLDELKQIWCSPEHQQLTPSWSFQFCARTSEHGTSSTSSSGSKWEELRDSRRVSV